MNNFIIVSLMGGLGDQINQYIFGRVLSEKLNCKEIYITDGSNGIVAWNNENGIIKAPTFTPKIVDRTGAGDAALSLITMLRSNEFPLDVALFYGNLAGSMLLSVMGNEKNLMSSELMSYTKKIINFVENLTR